MLSVMLWKWMSHLYMHEFLYF